MSLWLSDHDGLLTKYNISKADSAGHASIYVAGLSAGGSSSSATNGEDAADFALSFMEGYQNILPDFLEEKKVRWQAGLHIGSVTGGLVNVSKVPRFYVLGETVRTAFELHSSSLPTRVRISDIFKNQLGFIQKYRIEAAMKAEEESQETSATSAFWLSRNDSFH
ncbi:hypothetical protein RvY_08034 [Ramazzottius varieornatus]|uniref:Guanylate cyclase domain-containing protein n=1 Tax=Ramazzottius varieornatus TaxID=947166 RepID=A0A1D1VDM4_RAMVA|nr:hypothetical protein RvY_08034 [Ramazzottius varieornatus]